MLLCLNLFFYWLFYVPIHYWGHYRTVESVSHLTVMIVRHVMNLGVEPKMLAPIESQQLPLETVARAMIDGKW